MTPAGLVIRDAEAADLPAVRALLVETWHATYDGLYGWQRVAEITNAWHSLENLSSQLGREEGVFLVALVGDEIVATASARKERDRTALLTRLYVLPAWQGTGIGRTCCRWRWPVSPKRRWHVSKSRAATRPRSRFMSGWAFFCSVRLASTVTTTRRTRC